MLTKDWTPDEAERIAVLYQVATEMEHYAIGEDTGYLAKRAAQVRRIADLMAEERELAAVAS